MPDIVLGALYIVFLTQKASLIFIILNMTNCDLLSLETLFK